MLTTFSLILWTDPSWLLSATPVSTQSLVEGLSLSPDDGDQTDSGREGDMQSSNEERVEIRTTLGVAVTTLDVVGHSVGHPNIVTTQPNNIYQKSFLY